MTIQSSAVAFDNALADNYSLVAFNVITLEHAQAIVWGAERAKTPVILQLSENAIAYQRDASPLAAAMVALAADASVDCVLHLDHITRDDIAHKVADWGFSSLMWDSSTLPFEENLAATRDMATWAHTKGLWVEAELGEIGGKDGAHHPSARTKPTEAASFVAATRVDALAVAVGSSHAMAKKSAELDLDLIAEIAKHVNIPLVLHGSSGVPDPMLRDACSAGIRKVNIGTALNLAATSVIRDVLSENEALSDPRRFLGPARDQMADVVAHYLELLATPRS